MIAGPVRPVPDNGPMGSLTSIRDAIAAILAKEVKAYDLPDVCVKLGLGPGTDDEAYHSKRLYCLARLKDMDEEALLAVAERVDTEFPADHELQELVRWSNAGGAPILSGVTRNKLLESVLSDDLFAMREDGRVNPFEVLDHVWPLDSMRSTDSRCLDARGDVAQHVVTNADWSNRDLFEALGLPQASDDIWYRLLARVVHPEVCPVDRQEARVASINQHIERDGVQLTSAGRVSGYPAYKVGPIAPGVAGLAKNLIFAADGPKPEIVLTDAINNDVKIVKNAEYCLVFSDEIPHEGLHWGELVDWWIRRESFDGSRIDARGALGQRLLRSVPRSSPPARLIFETYYRRLDPECRERYPALIPEVYLHYDPQTVRELMGERRLTRQRMDFLLLPGGGQRIVIEVDGKHHYSKDALPSPEVYAEMAAADRQLRLLGYEVYRFGAAELTRGDSSVELIDRFFADLFSRHGIS